MPAVPKRTRTKDPLKVKSLKPTVVKNLDELVKPSLGTELIQMLDSESKKEVIESINSTAKIEESVPEMISEPKETPKVNDYTGFIKDGVEVVDVKHPAKKIIASTQLDKFGIPIQPGEHLNFDRI